MEEINLLGTGFRLHFLEDDMGYVINEHFNVCFPMFLFKLVLLIFSCYVLYRGVKYNARSSILYSYSLVVIGGLSQLISQAFYGVIFSNSSLSDVAELFPKNGGYAPLFHGRIIDSLYFPIISGVFPSWVPFWSGESFEYFRPVFNSSGLLSFIGVFVFTSLISSSFAADKKYLSKSYSQIKAKKYYENIENLIEEQIDKNEILKISTVYSTFQNDLTLFVLPFLIWGLSLLNLHLPAFILLVIFIIYAKESYIRLLFKRRKRCLDLVIITSDSVYLFYFITSDYKKGFHYENLFTLKRNEITVDNDSFDPIEFLPEQLDKVTTLVAFYLKKIGSYILSLAKNRTYDVLQIKTKVTNIKIRFNLSNRLVISDNKSVFNSFTNFNEEKYNNEVILKKNHVDVDYVARYLSFS